MRGGREGRVARPAPVKQEPRHAPPAAVTASGAGGTGDLSRLQRLVGNRAVTEQLRRKGGGSPSAGATAATADAKGNPVPPQLKAGIEQLSGLNVDDVHVHYNSAVPAQFGALAYAQGSEIHMAPGAEQHLPHEAWHVVQQAQGRIVPTHQL